MELSRRDFLKLAHLIPITAFIGRRNISTIPETLYTTEDADIETFTIPTGQVYQQPDGMIVIKNALAMSLTQSASYIEIPHRHDGYADFLPGIQPMPELEVMFISDVWAGEFWSEVVDSANAYRIQASTADSLAQRQSVEGVFYVKSCCVADLDGNLLRQDHKAPLLHTVEFRAAGGDLQFTPSENMAVYVGAKNASNYTS